MAYTELCKYCGYLFGWTRVKGSSLWMDCPRGGSMNQHGIGHRKNDSSN